MENGILRTKIGALRVVACMAGVASERDRELIEQCGKDIHELSLAGDANSVIRSLLRSCLQNSSESVSRKILPTLGVSIQKSAASEAIINAVIDKMVPA